MQRRWIIHKRYSKKFEKDFPEYSPIILQLLWDRGLKTQTAIDEFFNPDFETDLHDPFLMKDMDKAAGRIFAALQGDQKVMVYGDYDADGVTSSAVLMNTLAELKRVFKNMSRERAEEYLDIYIPDREKEGYGITEKAVEEISRRKPDLIITVDCGVSNVENIARINSPSELCFFTDGKDNYYLSLGLQCSFRHNGGMNAVFVDSHVVSKRANEVLPWSTFRTFWRND